MTIWDFVVDLCISLFDTVLCIGLDNRLYVIDLQTDKSVQNCTSYYGII